MSVQRYDAYYRGDTYLSDNGRFVEYKAHAATVAALESELVEARALLRQWYARTKRSKSAYVERLRGDTKRLLSAPTEEGGRDA